MVCQCQCCDKNKCKCFLKVRKDGYTNSLAEQHAHKFALKWLLDNKCKRALKYLIKIIPGDSQYLKSDPHKTAAKRIMKLKLFQKCLDFVEK